MTAEQTKEYFPPIQEITLQNLASSLKEWTYLFFLPIFRHRSVFKKV